MSITPGSHAVKTFFGRAMGVLCFSIGVGLTSSAWALQVHGTTYFEREESYARWGGCRFPDWTKSLQR